MKRFVIALAAVLAACGEPAHDAPFDPQSPAGKQAKAAITGSVTLEGEADASGVTVELQGPGRTYSVQSGADGAFRIAGVTPGTYAVAFKTRYFAPQTDTVAVPLGEELVLQARRLLARRAAVSGSALVERLENRTLVRSGGADVLLTKTASVRGGAAQAPGYRPAAAAVDTFSVTTRAGGDGAFVLNGVPAGVYRLVITGAGGESAELDGVTVTGEAATVTLDPVVVQAVTGYFDITGSAGGVESNAYTNDPLVTLHLDGFNAAAMRLGTSASGSAADCALGAETPYQAIATVALPAEGENTVCVQFVGADGRTTDVLTDGIVYDGGAPFGGVVSVNGGAGVVTAAGGAVTLALTAFDDVTRLGDVQLANRGAGTCAAALDAAPAEPYVTVKSWVLGNPVASAPGYRTVCARFADVAGNWSAPVTAAVYFDPQLYAPGFTARVRGVENRTDRTRNTKARVELAFTGPATDVTGVLIANDASFAGAAWRPFATPVTWTLEAGDGLKTVYVKVRDFAGNESARLQPQITLDQTGPETPVVALNDVDGDGFALDSTTVELRWTTPSDPDLAGFEVERFVEGVDTQFLTRAQPGAGAATLRDDAQATSGYPHHYRVRAKDDLGNLSSFSTVLTARPFTPVSSLTMLRGLTEARFFAQPLAGTFLVSTDWSYENPFPGDLYRDQLGFNVLAWERPTTFTGFNDRFAVRTSNVDNTLVYASTFAPALDERGFGGQPLGSGSSPYLGVAADGTATIIYSNSGIFQATDAGGAWAASARYATINFGGPRAGFSSNGNVFLVYESGMMFGPPYFDYRSAGAWSTITNPDTNIYAPSEYDSRLDASGNVYYAYANGYNAAAGTGLQGVRLLIRTASSGAWSSIFSYDSAGGTATALSVARSASRTCFTYTLAATNLRYACRTDAGGTVSPTTIAAVNASATAAGLKSTNQLVVAYVESATSDLKVWDQTSGTTATLSLNAATPALAVDANNTAHVAFRDTSTNDLLYYNNASGTWTGRTLASTGNQGYNPSVAVGPDGRVHIAYGDGQNSQLGYAVLAAPTAHRFTTGVAALDTAVDKAGAVHAVYRLTSNGFLYYGKWNGTSFGSTALLDTDLSAAIAPSIALDSNGKAHVVYANNAETAVRYATNASGSWAAQQLMTVTNAFRPRVIVAGGYVHALSGNKYARGAWNSWTSETVGGGFPDGPGDITAATDGKIHVVGYPGAVLDISALKHSYGGLGSWTAGLSDIGWYASQTVVAAPGGGVHVVASLNGDVVDLGWKAGTVTRRTIEASNNVGQGVRAVFDPAGAMHLVYGDSTNGSLRYATDAVTGAFQSIELAKSSELDYNGMFLVGGAPVVTFANGDAVLVEDFLTPLAASSVVRTTAY